MKTSHFVTFIMLVLLEILLCISFYFIYSSGIQKNYIDDLKQYTIERSIDFKAGKFFMEDNEEAEALELMSKKIAWIQSNYRANKGLLMHVYRNITTHEVIFSNARNENIESLMTDYIRQWDIQAFGKKDFAIFQLGNQSMVSILNEIDDDIVPVGTLELVFNYTPVRAEIDKLKTTLLWFASGIAVVLFIIFLVFTLTVGKRRREGKAGSVDDVDTHTDAKQFTEDTKEKLVFDSGNNPHKIKTLHQKRNVAKNEVKDNKEYSETSSSINKDMKIPATVLNKKQHIETKTQTKPNVEHSFLDDTKDKTRQYIHKVRL